MTRPRRFSSAQARMPRRGPRHSELKRFGKDRALEARIPYGWGFPVAVRRLLDMGDRGEWIVEALHRDLLRRQHVVDLAARRLGLDRLVVVEGVPAGMAGEQERGVGHVGLHIDRSRARRDDMGGVPRRV